MKTSLRMRYRMGYGMGWMKIESGVPPTGPKSVPLVVTAVHWVIGNFPDEPSAVRISIRRRKKRHQSIRKVTTSWFTRDLAIEIYKVN